MSDFSQSQVSEANKLNDEVKAFLTSNTNWKTGLESNFIEIGSRLAVIKSNLYWKIWGYKNFSTYMGSLEGRTKNYVALGVVQDLLGSIPQETLAKIGLSKASILRLMVKAKRPIGSGLVEQAQTLTRTQLKGIVSQELGIVQDEKDPWLDLGPVPMNDDERAEFYRGVNGVVRAADLGGAEITDWEDEPAIRKKQILQTLLAEFSATYPT